MQQPNQPQQITLLDVCKLPDVQIHSKTALFKYLINRQNQQMLKLRENIVKLSYTNKIIGVRGDEVGIMSKRLPLKFRETEREDGRGEGRGEGKGGGYGGQFREGFYDGSGFIAHRNFYVQPLPTVRKSVGQHKPEQHHLQQPQAKAPQIKIQPTHTHSSIPVQTTLTLDSNHPEQRYRTANTFRSRTQSMARLKFYKKQEPNSNEANKNFEVNGKGKYRQKIYQRNFKSFSNLLRDLKPNNHKYDRQDQTNRYTPILHQQNNLYKRYQRLYNKQQHPQQHQQLDQSNNLDSDPQQQPKNTTKNTQQTNTKFRKYKAEEQRKQGWKNGPRANKLISKNTNGDQQVEILLEED